MLAEDTEHGDIWSDKMRWVPYSCVVFIKWRNFNGGSNTIWRDTLRQSLHFETGVLRGFKTSYLSCCADEGPTLLMFHSMLNEPPVVTVKMVSPVELIPAKKPCWGIISIVTDEDAIIWRMSAISGKPPMWHQQCYCWGQGPELTW